MSFYCFAPSDSYSISFLHQSHLLPVVHSHEVVLAEADLNHCKKQLLTLGSHCNTSSILFAVPLETETNLCSQSHAGLVTPKEMDLADVVQPTGMISEGEAPALASGVPNPPDILAPVEIGKDVTPQHLGAPPQADMSGKVTGSSQVQQEFDSFPTPQISEASTPPSQSFRRGLSTFSIDSLLSDVVQRSPVSTSPDSKTNGSAPESLNVVPGSNPLGTAGSEPVVVKNNEVPATPPAAFLKPFVTAELSDETGLYGEIQALPESKEDILDFNALPTAEAVVAEQRTVLSHMSESSKELADQKIELAKPLALEKLTVEPAVNDSTTNLSSEMKQEDSASDSCDPKHSVQETTHHPKDVKLEDLPQADVSTTSTSKPPAVSDDALFKTPSPVNKRGRKPKVRTVSETETEAVLPPPPTPPKVEEIVPKEEPKEELPLPEEAANETIVESAVDPSVDLLFLALIGEEPADAVRMEKSLDELVADKQKELEEAARLERIRSEELAANLREQEAKSKNESSCPAPSPPMNVAKKVIGGAKRGRPKNKKRTTNSDTDTDTFSTGTLDEEDEKLMQEEFGEEQDDSNPSSSRRSHKARKRPHEEPTEEAPTTRRSSRIQEKGVTCYTPSTLLDSDFEYYDLEELFGESIDDQPTSSSSKKKPKKAAAPKSTPKAKPSGPKNCKRFVEEPSPHIPPPKKSRAAARMEVVEKRNGADPIIMSILDQVLTPKAAADSVVLDHFEFPVIRRAIVNRNTLCYAISMLQLMMRVPQIYSIVRTHKHDNGQKQEECFLCLMGEIISARPYVDEYSIFVTLMKKTWKGIEVDMMHCVMEAMQKFFNRFDDDYVKANPEIAENKPLEFSPIRSIFEITLRNDYTCVNCSHTNDALDKTIYLAIDLTKKSDGTMQSLVDNIQIPTSVYGMDCPNCPSTEFSCKTSFHKLPEVLLYFVPRVRTRKREKDMTVVQVQEQLILKDKEREHKYALCSFITHYGLTGNKGHYKQYEIDRSNGVKINEFDDARVILNSKLSRDITVVLAMFRKEDAVAKDLETDIIFDGRGNVVFCHPRHGHKH